MTDSKPSPGAPRPAQSSPPPAPLVAVDRAAAELRRGGILLIQAPGFAPLLVEAAEACGPETLARLERLAGAADPRGVKEPKPWIAPADDGLGQHAGRRRAVAQAPRPESGGRPQAGGQAVQAADIGHAIGTVIVHVAPPMGHLAHREVPAEPILQVAEMAFLVSRAGLERAADGD